ncbi:hypothetical protein BHE74_00007320 [Ensete ventricosum]|nr:hypothetical protein BHE74_00007320 [Ensete ventricosum]
MLCLGVTREQVGISELPKERTQSEMAEALRCAGRGTHGEIENRIGASPVTGWRRPCMRVVVCFSINQGKLLREHRGVTAGGRRGRGSDESRGAQLPKSKVSVRKEVDSEEYHSTVEADLPTAKKGT